MVGQYLNKKKILESLTEDDVTKIVMSLGSASPRKDSNGNLIFQSVCHNSESWKLYYYCNPDESKGYHGKYFKCWSRCGDCFGVVELVIRAKRAKGVTCPWYKALYYIAKLCNKLDYVMTDDEQEQEITVNTDFEWIDQLKKARKNKNNIPMQTAINENILEIFCYAPHTAWLNDNITQEALGVYEIGYYGLTNQITIPHRDLNERLIGIRGRYLDEEDVERFGKYMPLKINGKFLNHQLGSNLYGINVVWNRIKEAHKVMLVESEKGCLQSYSYFGSDSFTVAVCGSNITLTQQKILLQYLKCEEVIVAFDREYQDPDSFEFKAYYNKLIKKVSNLVLYCKVSLLLDKEYRLPYKASPTDMGKDVLLQLLDEKIVVTMDEVNNVLSPINLK